VTSSDRAAGSTNRLAVTPAPISACILKQMRRIETTIAIGGAAWRLSHATTAFAWIR
jgi:hypothetical protein